jgi:IclR family acetate operon transcriptional repressor
VTAAGGAGRDPVAERAARLLALVLERSPRTVTGLADELGLSAPEVAPLAAALERNDLLAWDSERSGLSPGAAVLRFASSGAGREDLVELAQPAMRRLAEESGETANLILCRPAGAEAIAQIDGACTTSSRRSAISATRRSSTSSSRACPRWRLPCVTGAAP